MGLKLGAGYRHGDLRQGEGRAASVWSPRRTGWSSAGVNARRATHAGPLAESVEGLFTFEVDARNVMLV